MIVLYLTSTGKHTEDASKAIFGETTEYKLPRFIPFHNGHELVWVEQDIGLPKVEKKKKKNG